MNFAPLALFRLLIIIAIAPTSLAQNDNPNWTFDSIQASLTKVRLSGDIDNTESGVLENISASLARLRNRYLQAYGERADLSEAIKSNLSEQYWQSMASDLSSLQALPGEKAKRLAVLEDVRDDLAIKVVFMSRGLGVIGLFPSVITVTVDTVTNGGKKISGLWVRCNPQRYGVTKNPLFVFNSATTPTTSALAPGRFILWIENSNKAVLASQTIVLGSAGKDTEYIQFSLP